MEGCAGIGLGEPGRGEPERPGVASGRMLRRRRRHSETAIVDMTLSIIGATPSRRNAGSADSQREEQARRQPRHPQPSVDSSRGGGRGRRMRAGAPLAGTPGRGESVQHRTTSSLPGSCAVVSRGAAAGPTPGPSRRRRRAGCAGISNDRASPTDRDTTGQRDRDELGFETGDVIGRACAVSEPRRPELEPPS